MSSNLAVEGEQKIKLFSTPFASGLVVLGMTMLIGGGKLVVDNAVEIAHQYGLSEKLIGLTILAVGTSLPELATSGMAAYRKNTDIAIGNVVGSNIFNIFFILGITGIINPAHYNSSLNFDLIISVIATIGLIIFMFTLRKHKLDRWEAVLMLMAYVSYTVYLVVSD
jgi:cation:H+ antiporter